MCTWTYKRYGCAYVFMMWMDYPVVGVDRVIRIMVMKLFQEASKRCRLLTEYQMRGVGQPFRSSIIRWAVMELSFCL